MRSDYILIGFLCLIWIGLYLVVKIIKKNSIKNCGDCRFYKRCWGKFNMSCHETPACSGFKEY
ncbi:MAG: hypothetical protein RSB50_06990 [Cetobacterium sp.]